MTQLIFNSNRWFSAVTDYSLQLAKHLKETDVRVIVASHGESSLFQKCLHYEIPFVVIPFFPTTLVHFIVSFVRVFKMIKKEQPSVVWVFEGREHTLCGIQKKIFKKLWKNTKLVRVRGQASQLKDSRTNRWLYNEATDGVVFAAEIIRKRTPFTFPDGKTLTHYYCTNFEEGVATLPARAYAFGEQSPQIDFSVPTFMVVGRYDPVKAPDLMVRAYASVEHDTPSQLVFVGFSENVQAKNIYELSKTQLGLGLTEEEGRYFASSENGLKKIYIFDERVKQLKNIMVAAHFAVVPSIGSEVICRVAVEFLQLGVPLISSDAGALPEVLKDSPCALFPSGDELALKIRLEEALDSLNDPESYKHKRSECAHFARSNYALENYSKLLDWVKLI